MSRCRSVVRVVDEVKLLVLETYALGWVKDVVSISVLAQEMYAVAWMEALSKWFGRLEDWSSSVAHESHRAWLSISGLPIHLWSEGLFRNVIGLWGTYLCVDAATEEPASFERARVLIGTASRAWID
ncbi:hypothetical protein V6N12_035552 [Hibiscus sabdariffa]|uniref:DUF4283 domain-containing protein n=1 Tax=Hibiscus sabdariffa TaxID=183260 RepID=A0ABR2EPV7_9ROSI